MKFYTRKLVYYNRFVLIVVDLFNAFADKIVCLKSFLPDLIFIFRTLPKETQCIKST